jgi:hypothetical protein
MSELLLANSGWLRLEFWMELVWIITWTVKNEMQVVEVLNPLARDFKSVGNLRKDLAGLQEDLAKAHNQVGVCCFEVCFISKYSKCQNLAHHVLLAAMGFKFQIFHRHTVSLALRSMVHLPALK